jgi:hypothetical protein
MSFSKEDEVPAAGFTVRDRRRFDAAGNEKSGALDAQQARPSAPKVEPEKPTQPREAPAKDETPKEYQPTTEELELSLDFASFIMSLASQALWQIGATEPPPGVVVPKDLEAARQTIDIITLMEIKTKGNVTPGEEHLLSEVLHELRVQYLKFSKRK